MHHQDRIHFMEDVDTAKAAKEVVEEEATLHEVEINITVNGCKIQGHNQQLIQAIKTRDHVNLTLLTVTESHKSVIFVDQFSNLREGMVKTALNHIQQCEEYELKEVFVTDITEECLLDSCCTSNVMGQQWKDQFFTNFSDEDLSDVKVLTSKAKYKFGVEKPVPAIEKF